MGSRFKGGKQPSHHSIDYWPQPSRKKEEEEEEDKDKKKEKPTHVDMLVAFTKLLDNILETQFGATEDEKFIGMGIQLHTAMYKGSPLPHEIIKQIEVIRHHKERVLLEFKVNKLKKEELNDVKTAWTLLSRMLYQKIPVDVMCQMHELKSKYESLF